MFDCIKCLKSLRLFLIDEELLMEDEMFYEQIFIFPSLLTFKINNLSYHVQQNISYMIYTISIIDNQ